MNISPTGFSTRCHQSRRGFTLIELLTVIAIIGILAAIIIPTVGAVRASANSAQSLSNIRQMAQGLQGYAADNKDYLPGGWNKVGMESYISWHRVLYPYVGINLDPTGSAASDVFICKVATSIVDIPGTISDVNKLNYTANGYYMPDRAYEVGGTLGNRPPYKMGQIPTPSQAALVFDGASRRVAALQGTANPFFRPALSGAPDAPVADNHISVDGAVNGDLARLAFRHNGKTTLHVAMADGSVKKYKRGELLNRHISPQN